MKNKIEISNKLISLAIGCDCTFIDVSHNFVVFSVNGKVDSVTWSYITYKYGKYKINLDTFIRLAEEKFISDYLLSPVLDGVVIFTLPEGEPAFESFGKQSERKLCPIENKIEALEWISTQV